MSVINLNFSYKGEDRSVDLSLTPKQHQGRVALYQACQGMEQGQRKKVANVARVFIQEFNHGRPINPKDFTERVKKLTGFSLPDGVIDFLRVAPEEVVEYEAFYNLIARDVVSPDKALSGMKQPKSQPPELPEAHHQASDIPPTQHEKERQNQDPSETVRVRKQVKLKPDQVKGKPQKVLGRSKGQPEPRTENAKPRPTDAPPSRQKGRTLNDGFLSGYLQQVGSRAGSGQRPDSGSPISGGEDPSATRRIEKTGNQELRAEGQNPRQKPAKKPDNRGFFQRLSASIWNGLSEFGSWVLSFFR